MSPKMTWDELIALLSELAQHYDTKFNVVPMEGVESVFLRFVPVA